MDGPDLEEADSIISRSGEESDLPFIYATWRNSACFGSERADELKHDEIERKKFFSALTVKIANILKKARVKIACPQRDLDQIIGFCVSTGDHLDWVYVRDDYRNIGIAKLLCPKTIKSVTRDMTVIGKAIAKKKNLEPS